MTFSNSSDGGTVQVAADDSVTVSDPYDERTAAAIVAPHGNTNNVTLAEPVWSGKYATLSIKGNRALQGTPDEKNGTGASVAEFSIVAAGTTGDDQQFRLYNRASKWVQASVV